MILTKEQQAEADAHRKQYEQLKAAGQGKAPRALPPPTQRGTVPIPDNAVIHREIIPGGWYWTTQLRRGEALRLINTSGKSCVALLAWSKADPSERLNHADTIKVQWAARLQKGRVILSDMGRALLSMIEDTSAAHDTLVGGSTVATNAARFGAGSFRNARENFLLAAGKLGLGRRDVMPCISFFAPVSVDDGGKFLWHEDRRHEGDFVDLRAEMDLLIAISNCPHPLDPATSYPHEAVEIIRYRAPAIGKDDLCRNASAESARAFENNEFLDVGMAG